VNESSAELCGAVEFKKRDGPSLVHTVHLGQMVTVTLPSQVICISTLSISTHLSLGPVCLNPLPPRLSTSVELDMPAVDFIQLALAFQSLELGPAPLIYRPQPLHPLSLLSRLPLLPPR
jgi:hypothetical protein